MWSRGEKEEEEEEEEEEEDEGFGSICQSLSWEFA